MSEDLIKRSNTIKELKECIIADHEAITEYPDDILKYNSGLLTAIQTVYDLPSADRPQGEWIIEIDANGYTYGRCSICGMKQYAGQLNFCPDCGAKMKRVDDENETQNSNLTFEKVMEEIQTQVIEFPDTHQKFIFARKIEMDGDSIKICDWEYKGIKDE